MGNLNDTRDLDLDGDMQAHAPDVTGVLCVARRLRRRLTTKRGTWPWAPAFGTDLRQYLLSKAPAWRIAKDAEFELLKDEQVDAVGVGLELRDNGRTIRLVVAVLCSAVRNFRFTMDITEAAGSLVALQVAA